MDIDTWISGLIVNGIFEREAVDIAGRIDDEVDRRVQGLIGEAEKFGVYYLFIEILCAKISRANKALKRNVSVLSMIVIPFTIFFKTCYFLLLKLLENKPIKFSHKLSN